MLHRQTSSGSVSNMSLHDTMSEKDSDRGSVLGDHLETDSVSGSGIIKGDIEFEEVKKSLFVIKCCMF